MNTRVCDFSSVSFPYKPTKIGRLGDRFRSTVHWVTETTWTCERLTITAWYTNPRTQTIFLIAVIKQSYRTLPSKTRKVVGLIIIIQCAWSKTTKREEAQNKGLFQCLAICYLTSGIIYVQHTFGNKAFNISDGCTSFQQFYHLW